MLSEYRKINCSTDDDDDDDTEPSCKQLHSIVKASSYAMELKFRLQYSMADKCRTSWLHACMKPDTVRYLGARDVGVSMG